MAMSKSIADEWDESGSSLDRSGFVPKLEITPRQHTTRKESTQERTTYSGPNTLLPESPQPEQEVNACSVEMELASVVVKKGKIIEYYIHENRRLREDLERRGANEEWKEKYEAERRRREEVEKKYEEKNKQGEQAAAKKKEQERQLAVEKREQERRAAGKRVEELERKVLRMKEERKEERNQERNKAEDFKKENDNLKKELARLKEEKTILTEENRILEGLVSTVVGAVVVYKK